MKAFSHIKMRTRIEKDRGTKNKWGRGGGGEKRRLIYVVDKGAKL